LQPRADIEDGWHLLSEKGKCVIESHRSKSQMLKKVAEKCAQEECENRFHHQATIINTIIPIVTFALGLLVDHFADIIDGVVLLWKMLFH
jgi:hypothetical protein